MTKKNKIVWRLREQPTPDSLKDLVKEEILSKEEAREILFSSEGQEDRDKKSLESEIKFLRELVEKLSNNRSQIITTIREIEVPYRRYPWYEPYGTWCSRYEDTSGTLIYDGSNIALSQNFSDIKTF